MHRAVRQAPQHLSAIAFEDADGHGNGTNDDETMNPAAHAAGTLIV
jgi:hypothetical protein